MEAAPELILDEKKTLAESYAQSEDRVLGYPTQEEQDTLIRVPGKIAIGAYLIALVECAERFSYYGTTVLFTNFIQQPLPFGSTTGAGIQPGALAFGQAAATGITTFNSFWIFLTPLFGAYVADTYLGRYRTLCYAAAIAILGHCLLVVSALPSTIQHPTLSVALLIVAIFINGIGTGAFKTNVSTLVCEQLESDELRLIRLPPRKVGEEGQLVIEDPALTVSRIYMYFYLLINVGCISGQISMVFCEKHQGYYLAFLLPTIVLLVCPVVLYFGKTRYVCTKPNGSVLGKAFKLFRHAAKGRWTSFKKLKAADFWENAKPSKMQASDRPDWMTFDDHFVDEVRRGLKACTVFSFYPVYWLAYNQLNTNLVSQAAVLRLDGVPNDLISNIDPITLIFMIPILDQLVYPALRSRGIVVSPIKKITAGFIAAGISMVIAAVIQWYIYSRSTCGDLAASPDCPPVDLSVWVQIPAYAFIAISEIFASISGLEYAFTKAPKSMRSLVMAAFLFMSALGSALGEAMILLSADPYLIWNYGVAAFLALTAGSVFWFAFRDLDSQENELNNLQSGIVVCAEVRDLVA